MEVPNMDKLIGLNNEREIESSNGAQQAYNDLEQVRIRSGVQWIRNNEYTMSFRNAVFTLLNVAIQNLIGANLMQQDKVSYWVGYINELQFIANEHNMFGINHIDAKDFPFVDLKQEEEVINE